MKIIDVVIGANYGDEGKGMTVNHLAYTTTLVVRFNGGAQAGHTVIHNGVRHVFHNFGSATMKGAATFLGPKFAIDPVSFFNEANELSGKINHKLVVIADPRCIVVTPYDIILNQLSEIKRGSNRHGSCGMGFGEAVRRNNDPLFSFTIEDMRNEYHLTAVMDKLNPYFWKRFEEIVKDDSLRSEAQRMIDDMKDRFINDLYDFVKLIPICEFDGIEKNYNHIIFEGAQGLRLDQNSPDFPHVTYSNTGLDNVLELLNKDRHELAVWYVTRPYLTRHGAGPLNNECLYDIIDETNKPNDYQGNLRFAPLDLGEFKTFVNKDYLKSDGFISTKHLSITCCDQVNNPNIEHIANSILANKVITCWSADGHWNLIEFPAESCI